MAIDQFTGVHFSDLKSNSRDIRYMKFDSNVSTKIKLNANGQQRQLKNRAFSVFFWKFHSAFSKRHSNVPTQKWNLSHMSYSNIFTVNLPISSRSYQILDPPLIVKKAMHLYTDLEWAPYRKTKFIWSTKYFI